MHLSFENTKYVFDDSKRPVLPYVEGACFEIKRHKPLTPFDNGKCYEPPEPEASSLSNPLLPDDILPPSKIVDPIDHLTPWDESSSDPSKIPPNTITERYLRHRPRKTEPHEDGKVRQLEILHQIRVRDGAYAQVVRCRVDGIRGLLVAKIFDPLYRWDDVHLDDDWSPVGFSESEWSCEAAAYERIQARGLDGRYTPRFEGCWSFDVPWELELVPASNTAINCATTGGGPHSRRNEEGRRQGFKVTRNVRLLLMEYIPGDSILNLLETGAYRGIPSAVRMDLLANIAEAQSALWYIRVSQGDRHTRNVMVGKYIEDDEVDDVGGAEQNGHRPWSPSSLHQANGEERSPNGQERPEGQEPGGSQKWRVVLIDFGRSVVRDLPNTCINIRGRVFPEGKLPQNPMTRCKGLWPVYPLCLEPGTQNEANWVDQKYDSFEAMRKWMEERWGKGSARAHLYQPIEYDKLCKPPSNKEEVEE
ncbi:hypothetical protein DHEL01_v210078 [Diaporthe helianthi]|uniref:Protein kinase domain-containing protein n=1 Tax=Diaporthe helianthi TaxID=158607 RepID=A0A2P5HMP3_DIAHE|nr:hypothetical protein DHEL01_v210078 [Diaporthe helianthi]